MTADELHILYLGSVSMDQVRNLVIYFSGAKRKGVAFRGWGGPVV